MEMGVGDHTEKGREVVPMEVELSDIAEKNLVPMEVKQSDDAERSLIRTEVSGDEVREEVELLSVDEERSLITAKVASGASEAVKLGIDGAGERGRCFCLPMRHRRIEKVPLLLRKSASNSQDYDPKMISIGPYHHGKVELQEAENIKPAIADLFISDSGKTMNEFMNAVLSDVEYFRSCYVQSSTEAYNNKQFARMMVLDGCLVLALIEMLIGPTTRTTKKYSRKIIYGLGNHALSCGTSDALCLVENQLPFQLLNLLLSLKYKGDEGIEMIASFVSRIHSDNFMHECEVELDASALHQMSPPHFLGLILGVSIKQSRDYFIEIDRSQRKNKKYSQLKNPREVFKFFRSVSELRAKGIYVKSTNSCSPASIKFTSFILYGRLDLPSIFISPNERVWYSNMIACELTPGNHRKCLTVAFVNFLKSLITHPDDVKELRRKRVLHSEVYCSDEQVVDLIQSITTFFVAEDLNGIYNHVREEIQKHYDSKVKTRLAELFHKSFSSPWTSIAFLAATLLLIMAFIQTFFTIFPRSNFSNAGKPGS